MAALTMIRRWRAGEERAAALPYGKVLGVCNEVGFREAADGVQSAD
jgi:hypothetical protein